MNKQSGCLEQCPDALDERRGIGAVDHAMVERRRQVHDLARKHRAVDVHGTGRDLVDADDRDLRVVDDGCRHDPAQRAEAADGDRRSTQLLEGHLAAAGCIRQSGDLLGTVPQVSSLSIRDDRNHQSLRRLRGDAEVHGMMTVDDSVLVVVARVHLWKITDGDHDRAHQERQHRQSRCSIAVLVVELASQPFDLGDIDLVHIREVGDPSLGDAPSVGRCCGATR